MIFTYVSSNGYNVVIYNNVNLSVCINTVPVWDIHWFHNKSLNVVQKNYL